MKQYFVKWIYLENNKKTNHDNFFDIKAQDTAFLTGQEIKKEIYKSYFHEPSHVTIELIQLLN